MGENRRRFLSVLFLLVVAAAVWFVLRQNGALVLWREGMQTAYTKNVFAMNTFFVMKAYGPKAENSLDEAEKRIRELEGLFSVNEEGSDIWRINHAEKLREITVNADTFSVVETALQLGEETDGALDITIFPVLREWGFTTSQFQVPEAERIEELLKKVDYRQVKVGAGANAEKTNPFIAVPEGVELDLGALAKGYTGDCLIELFREAGVTSAILDLGGNVQTLGTKPDGSLWNVAVKNPFHPNEELGVLQVADKAVITSGSYERYFVGEDGRKYWHILNPADGYPADNGLVSVTVVGESGIRCDGLSTALFVMGKERAADFWREKRDFEVILVTEDGQLFITEGLKDCFQGSEGWNAELIK